jgi:hypothetical protein
MRRDYHFDGCAKANIFCFMIVKSKAAWLAIDKPGDVSCDTILTLSSIMPVGVGGEADEAGDVALE